MNLCPLDEGGLIGPITSILHILNGQEEVDDEDVLMPGGDVTMDLAGMTSLGISDGIRDHLWPIIL